MKINLLINNPKGCIKNYVNIDPFGDTEGRNKGDVSNLDWVADQGGVSHLVAHDILPYFSFPRIFAILNNWISKLALNGKITISGVDFEEVARDLILEKLTTVEAAKLLWGSQESELEIKKSSLTILEVKDFLTKAGLRIETAVFDGYNYSIEASRFA